MIRGPEGVFVTSGEGEGEEVVGVAVDPLGVAVVPVAGATVGVVERFEAAPR